MLKQILIKRYNRPHRPVRDSLITVIGLLIINLILTSWLADRDVVAALLSPNRTSSLLTVFVAVVYLIIRLLTILFVPAILVRALWLIIAQKWLIRNNK